MGALASLQHSEFFQKVTALLLVFFCWPPEGVCLRHLGAPVFFLAVLNFPLTISRLDVVIKKRLPGNSQRAASTLDLLSAAKEISQVDLLRCVSFQIQEVL